MLPTCKVSHIPDQHGKPVSIMQPLIQKGQRPYHGWNSAITIRGARVELKGNTPQEVFEHLKQITKINNIEANENQLWTTLNFAWLPRSPKGARLVPAEAFFDRCTKPSGDGVGNKVSADKWFPTILDALGFALSVEPDAYNFAKFRSAVETFATMTDPAACYRLGDHRLAVTFLERSSVLSYKPAHLLKDAQDWFITTYNDVSQIVGISRITKDTAKLKYNW